MAGTLTPDVCVVGAGSAGLVAAAGAAQLGLSVVLIERCGDGRRLPQLWLRAVQGADRRRQGRPGAARRRRLRHRAGRAARSISARSWITCTEVIAAIAPNNSVERFERLGVRVLKEEARFVGRTELSGRPAPHQEQAHRAGDRLAADRAADPGPRRRALSHQRDDLRQPHPARAI